MTFQERYTYDQEKDLLGQGGFSTVIRAQDNYLGRTVALKFYKGETDEKYNQLSETRRAVQFQHPNIVQFYDLITIHAVDMHGNNSSMKVGIMEYINSGNLYDFLKTKPDIETFKKVMIGFLKGLQYIHSKGMIHRDIKPQNILMNVDAGRWMPKLADFGISKELATSRAGVSKLIGTVEYMAPEQFHPEKYGIKGRIATNVDLWAFGVILYEVFSGIPFFGKRSKGLSTEEIMDNIFNKNLPEQLKMFPKPFDQIIRLCLVKDANKRVKDAGQLIEMLKHNHALVAAPAERKEKESVPVKEIKKEPETVASAPSNYKFLYWAIPLAVVVIVLIFTILIVNKSGTNPGDKAIIAAEIKDSLPIAADTATADYTEGIFMRYFEMGRLMFNNESFKLAYEYYNKANAVKPGDSAVLSRIAEIRKILYGNSDTILSSQEQGVVAQNQSKPGDLKEQGSEKKSATDNPAPSNLVKPAIIDSVKPTADDAGVKNVDQPLDANEVKLSMLLQPEKKGVMRGMRFLYSQKNVKDLESDAGGTLQKEKSKNLTYLVPLNPEKTENAMIDYVFNNNSLREIHVATVQPSKESATGLYSALKKYYDNKFGDAKPVKDGWLWRGSDVKTKESYEIILRNPGSAGISLSYFLKE